MCYTVTSTIKEVANMRQKLYGNHVQSCCEVCQHGRRSADSQVVLCVHKGVMQLHQTCRKFVYDPLRRIPHRQPMPESFSKDDFSLDD